MFHPNYKFLKGIHEEKIKQAEHRHNLLFALTQNESKAEVEEQQRSHAPAGLSANDQHTFWQPSITFQANEKSALGLTLILSFLCWFIISLSILSHF